MFTALLMDAAFGPNQKKALSPARLTALLFCGVLLAPGKLVYLPLATLLLLVPAARLGHHARAKKCAYLGRLSGAGAAAEYGPSDRYAAPRADRSADHGGGGRDRAVKSRPAEPDEAYEAEICGESTLENYVKRLYYYVDDNRSPTAREVAFWVQAMQEGDVSPAVLGQSFLFSPDRANSYTDGQAFYTMASYALLGTDVTDGNADAYLPYFAEGGAVQAYKAAVQPDQLCRELRRAGCGRRHDG